MLHKQNLNDTIVLVNTADGLLTFLNNMVVQDGHTISLSMLNIQVTIDGTGIPNISTIKQSVVDAYGMSTSVVRRLYYNNQYSNGSIVTNTEWHDRWLKSPPSYEVYRDWKYGLRQNVLL